MAIAITFDLKRDSLEDDFKVCRQKIPCQIPITSQMVDFIEKTVNMNVKNRECFIIKAICSIDAYTILLSMPFYKVEITVHSLKTYDGDALEIKPITQIF